MDQAGATTRQAGSLPIPRWEFIALCAALMALNALAIDIMLPGLQQIGAALGVENPNHRQYVITAYIIAFGVAQLGFGPISDRFGRRGPLLIRLGIYILAAFAAAIATDFWTLLACRFMQGAGAAATRVIAISVIRDSFGGRRMAEIMSLVFMVFMAVPVVAPGLGQIIMYAGSTYDMAMIWVGIIILGLLAIVLYGAVNWLERKFTRGQNIKTI